MHEPAPLATVLTDFGNIAVAGPILLVALAWLWQARLHLVALILALDAAGAVTTTLLLRLISRRIGGAWFGTPWHLTTGAPSGHAAVSTVVYGGIGALFALHAHGTTRIAGVLLAVLLMLGVDVTRISLGFHSPADVAAGLILGTAFAAIPIAAIAPGRAQWPGMALFLLCLVATATIMQIIGLRFDSTDFL